LPRNEFWIIPIYTVFSGDKNFKRQKRASGINGELMIQRQRGGIFISGLNDITL